jgi:hypothetical protein
MIGSGTAVEFSAVVAQLQVKRCGQRSAYQRFQVLLVAVACFNLQRHCDSLSCGCMQAKTELFSSSSLQIERFTLSI